MFRRALLFTSLLAGCSAAGCSTANGSSDGLVPVSGGDAGATADGTTPSGSYPSCQACLSDTDCPSGGDCAQFGGDIYCAPPCGAGGACSSDRACATLTTAAGDQVDVCVPRGDVCGTTPGADAGTPASDTGTTTTPPPSDAGSGGTPTTCNGLVAPSVSSTCYCSPSTHTCQPNGCYGGWWCNPTTSKCQSAPTNCGTTTPDAGGGSVDSGVPVGPPGTVTGSGGKVANLRFAVAGDTRPASDNATSGYPTAIITQIYQDIQAGNYAFALSTGDYCFAGPSTNNAAAQFQIYLTARAQFTGTWFPAMGNHECTGATASNCVPGSSDWPSNSYNAMMSMLYAPIGQTKPYYSVRIDANDGSWTSKFVFIAANAWDSTQGSWLDSALAQPTTYTFVIRHEPKAATTAPGTSPSEQIMANYPYTLAIVGHTHTYGKTGSQQVTIGNGGAPLTSTGNFGYAEIQRRASDGAIVVDMHDYQTNAIDSSFHFALTATGAPAPP